MRNTISVVAGLLLAVSMPHATAQDSSQADEKAIQAPPALMHVEGLGSTPDGQVIASVGAGPWAPTSALHAVDPASSGTLAPMSAIVRLPDSVTRPTRAVRLSKGFWSGQMLVADQLTGEFFRVQIESINGVWQGCVFPTTLTAGGALADVSVDEAGSVVIVRQAEADSPAQVRRLDLATSPSSAIDRVQAIPGGLRLTFSEPIVRRVRESTDAYTVEQWYDVPTPAGGLTRCEAQTLEVMEARAVGEAAVELILAGLAPGRVVHISAKVESPRAGQPSAREAWYTLREMPASPEHRVPDLRVMVFSKTAGFRHSSIPDGVKSIQTLGRQYGFDVHATEDAAYFNDAMLHSYAAIIFLSTTGDVLDGDQQAAFERYIRAGGGYVGVHAASDTEYEWPWYGKLVGAYFLGHPAIQDATIRVLDREHIATNMLPADWPRRDEWYNFRSKPGHVHVLANLDETTYSGGTMNNDHPIAWCHEFDGGRAFYTAGGHTEESFGEDLFLRHLAGGIYWASGRTHLPE